MNNVNSKNIQQSSLEYSNLPTVTKSEMKALIIRFTDYFR